MMRSILTGAFLCCATLAQGAPINGNFSDGLNGYTLDACGFNCGRPTDPFFDILANGSDPYLEVNTGTTLLGVTQASATTEIEITATSDTLSFDAVKFATENDTGSSGSGPFFDALSILVIDESNGFHFLFEILDTGPVFNPFSNSNVNVSQKIASDPFFDTGVEADLSFFVGQTLTLGIFAFSESDGVVLYGGFDNFALSGNPIAAIPLPAGLPLLLCAIGFLGLSRRRLKA